MGWLAIINLLMTLPIIAYIIWDDTQREKEFKELVKRSHKFVASKWHE